MTATRFCLTIVAAAMALPIVSFAQAPATSGATGDTRMRTTPDTTQGRRDASSRDTSTEQRTKAQQGNMNPSDTELAREAQQQITDDPSLSNYAERITIVAKKGTVTLRGAVASNQDKTAIQRRVEAVSGTKRVMNELKVTGTGAGMGTGTEAGTETGTTDSSRRTY